MDRIDALLQAFLAGTASPAETAELQALLEGSAPARRRLVEQSTLDGYLQDVFKQATHPPAVRRLAPLRPPAWPWIAAAAAVVLFAVVVGLTLKPAPRPEPVARQPRPVEPPREPERRPEEPKRPEEPARVPEKPEPPPRAPEPPPPNPLPPPAPEPEPRPEPPPPPKTEPAVARLIEEQGARDLVAGADLDVETEAIVEFPDGTRLTLGEKTSIRAIAPDGLRVETGAIDADVARRPKDKPFIFRTAHAEAIIAGTALRLVVTADSTHLEVTKGAAKLSRGGKSIDVKAGTFAVATAKSLSPAQPIPKEETLLSLDFEEASPLVDLGAVEKGPGGRSCLAGVSAGGVCKLRIGDGAKGIFTVRGGETLSFDYWVDAKAHKVNMSVHNRTQGRTHEITVPNLVRGRWAQATLRLADFAGTPREGDWIISLYMQGVSDGPVKFYVDNVRLTRPRKEKK